MIPIAGSAYTYSYATLGEIFAWIIGWDLILEYVVSNVAVAVGFAGYTKAQLAVFGLNLPEKFASPVWAGGQWTGAYFNLPGFLIVFVLTLLLVRGVKESAETNNIMVAVKIGAILTFLVVGGMLVKPANWHPFAPSGFAGIVTGGAIVFFTYIGFDSVSTAAEESRNPQKDLPFGIIMSLVVCTLLYVGVAVVLLGMMKYTTFVSGAAAEAPVAYAMKYLGVHPLFRSVIVIGALTGMISSLLVFQYGQARIWYAMSRDGLLPKLFSAVHPRFKTPHISTWIACFAVGIPAGLVDIGDAADLANIGTLFAFVLVSLGVIILRRRQPDRKRAFRVPFVPWFPLISIVLCGGLMMGLTVITWLRFVIWLGLGLLIYSSTAATGASSRRSRDSVSQSALSAGAACRPGSRISALNEAPPRKSSPRIYNRSDASALDRPPNSFLCDFSQGRVASASRGRDRAGHSARTAPASRRTRHTGRGRCTLPLRRFPRFPAFLQEHHRAPANCQTITN